MTNIYDKNMKYLYFTYIFRQNTHRVSKYLVKILDYTLNYVNLCK